MSQRSYPQMTVFRILQAVLIALWIAVLAVPVAASSPDDKGEPQRQVQEAASTESAEPSVATREAMKVFTDPETGEIIARPVRQQTEVLSVPLANALSRSTEGLQVFDLPNGGKGVYLEGRFQHVLKVRVKPDGSLETVCVNHPQEAEDVVRGESVGRDPESRDK